MVSPVTANARPDTRSCSIPRPTSAQCPTTRLTGPPGSARHLGGRDSGSRLAARSGLLACAPARRCRTGPEAAVAVLFLSRWDADARPGDIGGARLRPPDDAQHGIRRSAPGCGCWAARSPPCAAAQLDHRIRSHARARCDRVLSGERGECDFAKDLAADLPLLTLADVLGVAPKRDRWLLFDWSNRVIGYPDPDYASSLSSIRPGERRLSRTPAPARACPTSTPMPTCLRRRSGTAPVMMTACRARASRRSSTRARPMSCAPIQR